MSGALRKGFEGTINLNSGTYGTPIWAEVAIAVDNNVPDTMDEGDASARLGGGLKRAEPTLQNVSLEFTILKDTSNAQFLALRTAYLARAAVDIVCCSGALGTAGNTYVRSDWKIFTFSAGEPINGLQTVNVVMKPCYPVNATVQGITPMS